MLEAPDLDDERIVTCLQEEYGLSVGQIAFLPLGADLSTAVYRVLTTQATPYFVKVRQGDFDESAVTVPKFLSDLGIKQIIPAIATRTGQLWAPLGLFKVILYPFVEGRNGYELSLSDQQRVEFGAALKRFHTATVPSALTQHIRRETFSPQWRDRAKWFLEYIQHQTFRDPVAAALAAFLQAKRNATLDLVNRSEQLAQAFQRKSPQLILCHADIHAWNLLIDSNGSLYIVDWDTLMFAPKERDLMFIGAGLGGNGHSLEEEERLFYQGYGATSIDPLGIAYYRHERIIEDIAVYCEQILLSDEGGEDRKQGLEAVKFNYLPNSTIALASLSFGDGA